MTEIRCTAWEALTTYYDKIGDTHTLKIVGGRVHWQSVDPSRTGRTVKVQRFHENGSLRVMSSYLQPECDVTLTEV